MASRKGAQGSQGSSGGARPRKEDQKDHSYFPYYRGETLKGGGDPPRRETDEEIASRYVTRNPVSYRALLLAIRKGRMSGEAYGQDAETAAIAREVKKIGGG